jgi:hypothetical protein
MFEVGATEEEKEKEEGWLYSPVGALALSMTLIVLFRFST